MPFFLQCLGVHVPFLPSAFECGKIVINQTLSKIIVCHWWVIYSYTAFAKGSHEVYLGYIFFENSQYCDHS